MRRSSSVVLVLSVLAVLLAPLPAAAQESDEAAVRAVVKRMFDGMRSRDTTMLRSAFAEQALFYSVRNDSVQTDTPSDFIGSIATAAPGRVLDEVLHDVEVRIDGPLATVWTYYDFFVGEQFSHCGYDAMMLLKTKNEWKIVSLADTRRRTDCRQMRGS